MASDSSKRPGAAANGFLTPVMTLKGHEPVTHTLPNPNGEKRVLHDVSSVCYFSDGERLISGSIDKTARQWDLRVGKEIEEARDFREQRILAVGVSKDGRWIVTAGKDVDDQAAELKVCEVKTGIVRTFEGHSRHITSIDISADSTLLVSGSAGCAARIWELDTGKLVFKIDVDMSYGMVRFSQDSKKLALKSGVDDSWLEVWDVQAQKKDVSIQKSTSYKFFPATPVFWTTKDKTIVANTPFKDDVGTTTKPEDGHYKFHAADIIYEFDALTLETVGAPFKGHTNCITSLALSFDCALLASASWDHTIKLWAFESRQLLASFDIQYYARLLFSPNSHQLACTRQRDTKIYIYDIPPKILANICPAQETQPNTSDLLHSNAIPRAGRRKPVISPTTSFAHRQPKPSPTTRSQRPTFFHYLRKFISSSRANAAPPVLRDPLDFPATSPLPRNFLPLAQGSSGMNPHENVPPIPTLPTTESFKERLHDLSNWWPVRTGHALPPIVDVPLAQGKERNASADAPPKNSGEWIADEDYVPSRPPSTNPNSQPPAVQINTGEHGNGRLCGCF